VVKYTIKSGTTEAVISSLGGTVLSFKVDGQDVLYPWHETPEGKERGGCPVCAPWFGSAPEFGKQKHGYLRNLEATKVTTDGHNTEFSFIQYGDSKYPWWLSYTLRHAIKEKQLLSYLYVRRLNNRALGDAPINPAFHPYFIGNGNDTPVIMGSTVYFGFSEKARVITLKNQTVSIEMPKKKILMELNGEFQKSKSNLVFWSDSPDKYFCVEPVMKDKELFNTPKGRTLGIEDSAEISMTISVI